METNMQGIVPDIPKQANCAKTKKRPKYEPGIELTGEATRVVDYGAFFDVGGAVGLLHKSKLGTRVGTAHHYVTPGMKVQLVVLKQPQGKLSFGLPEGTALAINADGLAALAAWETVEKLHSTWQPVEVEVLQVVRAHGKNGCAGLPYGVVAMINGLRGFIPASHLHPFRWQQFFELRGKRLWVIVLEADQSRDMLVLSHTEANHMIRSQFIEQLKVRMATEGQVVLEGDVSGTVDYGVFVNLAPLINGLLHVTEFPPGVTDPHSFTGRVQVAVQHIREDNKISLTMKDLGI